MTNRKNKNRKKVTMLDVWKARYLYLLVLPMVLWVAIFCYGPMYGILLAFKNYNVKMGILGSEWGGLKNFRRIFITPEAGRAIVNTITISLHRLAFQFPVPILCAILITEMPGKKIKKAYQTIFTLPHFLSWVVVSVILTNFFAIDGAINTLLANIGLDRVKFLGRPEIFKPLLYITANWKEAGWSAIIYMAAIAGIDTTLYDAARVDGASRLRQIWHVTLPGIKATIVIMFILQVGSIMNAGFDQIFNMRNGLVRNAVNILDVYVYDITFGSAPNYGFSTAVGLFKAVINFILLIAANQLAGKMTGDKLFV